MRFPVHPDRRPVVVSGASSGIGAAVARTFAAAGHPVALGARRVERLEELAAELRAAGAEVAVAPLDVTSDDSVAAFGEAVGAALGPVEIVVSNAGRLDPGVVHEVETALMAAELEVNVLGAHRLVRAFVPGMVERRRGDFVVVSSDVADVVRPFMSGYAAGKWGVEGMARSMRYELEGTGVRVSVVRPGPTLTEMGMDWSPEDTVMVLEQWTRLGMARSPHFLKPAAIAEAIRTVATLPRGVHMPLVEVQPEVQLHPDVPLQEES